MKPFVYIELKWASPRENLSSGFSEKVVFKPACSDAGTRLKTKISLAVSLDIILLKTRITKAGLANPRRQIFSRRGPLIIVGFIVGRVFQS